MNGAARLPITNCKMLNFKLQGESSERTKRIKKNLIKHKLRKKSSPYMIMIPKRWHISFLSVNVITPRQHM
jgi:hypothetical protein